MTVNQFKLVLGDSIFECYELEGDSFYAHDIEEGEEGINYLLEIDSILNCLEIEYPVLNFILSEKDFNIHELSDFTMRCRDTYCQDDPRVITLEAFKYLVLELTSDPGHYPIAHTLAYALISMSLATILDTAAYQASYFN